MTLNIAQLKKGDIMLKYHDKSSVSKVISFGQKLVGQTNTTIVHAGLLCDQVHIVESQGSGVIINNLLTGNNQYGYKVYRANSSTLGDGAGTCAKIFADVHKLNGNLPYTIAGAATSLLNVPQSFAKSPTTMDELIGQILEGKASPFFCSQIVVYIYQFVAAQNGLLAASVFNVDDAKASPAHLATLLSSNSAFKYIGELQASTNGKNQNNNSYLRNR